MRCTRSTHTIQPLNYTFPLTILMRRPRQEHRSVFANHFIFVQLCVPLPPMLGLYSTDESQTHICSSVIDWTTWSTRKGASYDRFQILLHSRCLPRASIAYSLFIHATWIISVTFSPMEIHRFERLSDISFACTHASVLAAPSVNMRARFSVPFRFEVPTRYISQSIVHVSLINIQPVCLPLTINSFTAKKRGHRENEPSSIIIVT